MKPAIGPIGWMLLGSALTTAVLAGGLVAQVIPAGLVEVGKNDAWVAAIIGGLISGTLTVVGGRFALAAARETISAQQLATARSDAIKEENALRFIGTSTIRLHGIARELIVAIHTEQAAVEKIVNNLSDRCKYIERLIEIKAPSGARIYSTVAIMCQHTERATDVVDKILEQRFLNNTQRMAATKIVSEVAAFSRELIILTGAERARLMQTIDGTPARITENSFAQLVIDMEKGFRNSVGEYLAESN